MNEMYLNPFFIDDVMGKKNRNNKIMNESAILNTKTYNAFYTRLVELGCNVFEWENLPPTIDERFLEMVLFTKGYALFYKDKELDEFLALMCTIGGELSVYNIPLHRQAFASNGYTYSTNHKESVIIFSNYMRVPDINNVMLYARRPAELERVIDVNVKGQKTPVMLLTDQKQRLTLENLYMKYEGNQPFIFGDKSLNNTLDGIKALNTNTPYVADKLQALKQNIWNEALTWLGISNLDLSKKE